MDESGVQIGCPKGEHIVVPTWINELYTSSPENRKTLTIIETIVADGRTPLPPFIITPGKKIMDNWMAAELIGNERLACSDSGYINNTIAMEYLDHLIEHSHAGPQKLWKILLLDGHESHRTEEFQLKAANHHIKLFYFPSHLTHVLQPLDVGVFRPWKHYHNLAIQAALRSLDFDYTITSFFRDLTQIRSQTMQRHTITNAFKSSGMWPPSSKAGIKKMGEYQKKRSTTEADDNDGLELPKLPDPTRDIWTTATTVRALGGRDPTQFSEPSVQLFHDTMRSVDIQLQKSQLVSLQHTVLQTKLQNKKRHRVTSRRSVHKGGPSASVTDLRERIQIRNESRNGEALRKARRNLTQAINKARNTLKTRGIQARKDNKARLERIRQAELTGGLVPAEDPPIREPDKDPTAYEAATCTEEAYPELVQQVRELEAREQGQDYDTEPTDIVFRLGSSGIRDTVEDYMDSSPPPAEALVDSSDVDSITGQADFVRIPDFSDM